MTLTFELDLGRVKTHQSAKQLAHKDHSIQKLSSEHTHTHRIDYSNRTTKLNSTERASTDASVKHLGVRIYLINTI